MNTNHQDLIRDLSDPDETIRRYAAGDLARLRATGAVPALVAALADSSAAVREAVVDALASIGGNQTATAILPALASDDPGCANAACEALRILGAESIRALIFAAQMGDRDVRLFAIDVIGLIGDPAAATALSWLLRDPDPNIAASAANALGQVGGNEAVPALIAALNSDAWVRCAIAGSLGRIGGPEATAALTRLLADEDETVRFLAAQTLGQCGGPAAVAPLAASVGQANRSLMGTVLDALDAVTERMTAAEIGSLRDQVELESLRTLIADADDSLRAQSVNFFGRLDKAAAELARSTPLVVDGTHLAEGGDR